MAQKKEKKVFEFNINKIIFIFIFLASLLKATFSHPLTITELMLCDNNNFKHTTKDIEQITLSSIDSGTLDRKKITVLDELTCSPDEIRNEETLNINDFKTLYAVVHFSNLEKDAHKNISMYWVFTQDPSVTEKTSFKIENTYYSERLGKHINSFEDKILEAEKRCNLKSSLVIACSIIDVIIYKSKHFRTYSSKNFDKNVHLGKWELLIYEKGNVKHEPLETIQFTVTR